MQSLYLSTEHRGPGIEYAEAPIEALVSRVYDGERSLHVQHKQRFPHHSEGHWASSRKEWYSE